MNKRYLWGMSLLLGLFFIGCGTDTSQEKENLQELQELKISKMYNGSDLSAVAEAIKASQGEQ